MSYFDEEMKEQYIYAGYKNHTHFFIHIQENMRDFTEEISKRVYHYLVNLRKIQRYEENVVIYQIHPVSCIVQLVIIQNYDKDPSTRFQYDNQYMSKYFWELWNLPRNTFINNNSKNEDDDSAFIVEYNYQNRCYTNYHLIETFDEWMMYHLPEDFVRNQPFPIHNLNELYVMKEILE
jgi:hypothetical protein